MSGQWQGREWTGSIAAGEVSTGRPWGQGDEVPTISFTVPSSDLFELDQDHFLRGMIGGWLARCWVSFIHAGSTMIVPHFAQGGSSSDPTDAANTALAGATSALAGATSVLVDLGDEARDGSEVADILVTALAGIGVTATADGATVTVFNATDLVVPPNVDTTDTTLRGVEGYVRDDWGDIGGSQNLTGGTNANVIVHLGQVRAALARGGRVLAVGVWGSGNFGEGGEGPRCGAFTGPAYSTNPGTLTRLREDRISTVLPSGPSVAELGTCSVAVFEAAAFDAADRLWLSNRCGGGSGVGGIRYRVHGRTPVGRGTLGTGEAMLVDVASSTSAAVEFGSTYTPTIVQTLNVGYFNVYCGMFAVIEWPDDDGNYPANGRWLIQYGDHGTDYGRGTQVAAGPAILDIETTWHRQDLPQWTMVDVIAITRTTAALGAGESSRSGIYDFPDNNVPSLTPASLVGDAGILTLVSGGTSTTTLATPIPIGTEVIGANRTIAYGNNYATQTGVALSTFTLNVFLESGSAASSFVAQEGWQGQDNPQTWHDLVRGSRNRGAAAGGGARIGPVTEVEYRTRTSTGNTGMSTANLNDPHPATMSVDSDPTGGTDDSPWAITPGEYFTIERQGIVAA